MHEFVVEGLSLTVNEIPVTENKNMRIQGLCSLQIQSDMGNLKDTLLIFSKTHMYASNKINIKGTAYFDRKRLPGNKIHYLLNHAMIFESTDIVKDVLIMLNKEEVDQLIDKLEIKFYNKRIDHLNIQESKIFEIAVNLAFRARIVYIKNFEMPSRLKTKYLNVLKEYSIIREVVFLVECEYSDIFDSALIIEEDRIVSLDKSECEAYFRRQRFSVFSIQGSELRTSRRELRTEEIQPAKISVKNEGVYDFAPIFESYKTQNLVMLKHKDLSFWDRLFLLDIYKVNLTQAFLTGFKRYETVFKRQEHRNKLLRSIGPHIFLILSIRVFQELIKCDWKEALPEFLGWALPLLLCSRNNLVLPLLIGLRYFYLQELSIRRVADIVFNIFRGGYSIYEHKLMSASVCLCIFYQYSSIFEEDSQTLNYYMNIIITPGTYIMSILVYIFFTHIITLSLIGFMFNNVFMLVSLIYCTFTNLIYAFLMGKRFRACIIGYYLGTFFIEPYPAIETPWFRYLFYTYQYIFHFSTFIDNVYKDSFASKMQLIHLLVYCSICYIMFCYKIFKK